MHSFPEKLFSESLQLCSPVEAMLYEQGLVDSEVLRTGGAAHENVGHLDFGTAEATMWIGPALAATLTWLFSIGQEVLREKIKSSLGAVLNTEGGQPEAGLPSEIIGQIRAKLDEECRKRGIDEATSSRCSDAIVSVLINNAALISQGAQK